MAVLAQDGSHNSAKLSDVRAPDVLEDLGARGAEFAASSAVTTFQRAWHNATDDNYLTLFGFRRFRTAHLMNLRFLEEEIDKIDHEIYQAGLKLDNSYKTVDRLALKHAKLDNDMANIGEQVHEEMRRKLRALLKQYGMHDLLGRPISSDIALR